MELKVVCQCGQKFKFDVEPVNGRMPFTVNCPVCNADGTETANGLLAQSFSSPPPPLTTSTAPPPVTANKLSIHREAPAPSAAPPALAPLRNTSTPPPIGAVAPLSTDKKPRSQADGEFSLVRGIIGAVLGSAVGCGLLFAFWLWAHFRFPLMGIAVGAAAGYGARWLARGTDTTLGIITAVIATGSVFGTFFLMYGEFAIFNIISIVICASVAYRASSE